MISQTAGFNTDSGRPRHNGIVHRTEFSLICQNNTKIEDLKMKYRKI
jgi:hypothetical protein